MRIVSLLAAACAISLAQLQPATAITSTFDASAEGWTLGNADNPAVPPVGNGTLTFNPAGFITGTELQGAPINAFFAPAAYLGDKSSFYGGTISFFLRSQATDGVAYSAVYLFGNGKVISNASTFPGTIATPFSFNLTESSGWLTYSGGANYGGALLSQAEFLAVLANLTGVAILIDWLTGTDTAVDLDIVSLLPPPGSAVPLPGALPLFAGGLGLMALLARRRKRNAPAA